MRKIKGTMFLILINICILGLLCSCGNKREEGSKDKVEFRYAASTKDYSGYLYYTDDYFTNDANIYNPSLATLSLGLAMSAFASLDVESPNDYTYRYVNCENLLRSIGFKNVYANDDFKKKPTCDSMGCVFGTKKINDYTLIAIGIRGAGYQQEWASNCKCGDGIMEPHHEGFNDGANIVLRELNDYIDRYSIEGKIKIWSAGFSRASAVNNLLIGRIDTLLSLNNPILPYSVTTTKNDLYAYCFEVPMGASFNSSVNPRSEDYDNIFNIINTCDPVPMVPMEGLGFTRYGVDKYLPNPLNDMNYVEDLKVIKTFYNLQSASKEIGEYSVDKFVYYDSIGEDKDRYSNNRTINFNGGLFVKDLLNKIIEEGISDRVIFKKEIQSGLMEVFSMLHQNDTMDESLFPILGAFVSYLIRSGDIDYMIEEIMHNPDQFVDDLLPLIKKSVEDSYMLVNVSSVEFCEQIKGFISILTKVFNRHLYTLFPFLSRNNLNALAQAHQPIVCMANLQAMDPNYNFLPIECSMDGGYYYLEIPYKDDLGKVVITMDGVDIARINDGSAIKLSMYTYGILEDNFIAYLPKGHSFSITTNLSDCSITQYIPTLEGMHSVSKSVVKSETQNEYIISFEG